MVFDSIMDEIMTKDPRTPGSDPASHPSSNRLPEEAVHPRTTADESQRIMLLTAAQALPDELAWRLPWRSGESRLCKNTHLVRHGWAQDT